jgi:membrane-bound lytic murein transglycosylase B
MCQVIFFARMLNLHSKPLRFLMTQLLPVALTVLILLLPAALRAEEPERFETWLDELRGEALSKGISEATLDATLAEVELVPRVITLDRNQPEFKLTFDQYIQRVLTDAKVAEGRQLLTRHQELLLKLQKQYGVQPRFLIALWGIESNYGRLSGGFPVIDAILTLAYDGRRPAYFRGELLAALKILDDGHISVGEMTGSWAGAMGQMQFMPSTFRRFAVDDDGDGKADIWNNLDDVLASGANYLHRAGWVPGQLWGREVRLPRDFNRNVVGLKISKPLSSWVTLGVRRVDGRRLPQAPDLQASVIEPDGPGRRAFLVYENFRTLLKWNRSDYFGLTVGILSDRIDRR